MSLIARFGGFLVLILAITMAHSQRRVDPIKPVSPKNQPKEDHQINDPQSNEEPSGDGYSGDEFSGDGYSGDGYSGDGFSGDGFSGNEPFDEIFADRIGDDRRPVKEIRRRPRT